MGHGNKNEKIGYWFDEAPVRMGVEDRTDYLIYPINNDLRFVGPVVNRK